MEIKYYKDDRLSYTNRKRYRKISSLSPTYTEEQKSVLLGDGASTSIKTSIEHICNYVTIDGTRWFVTSYRYLNGKQVQLNLQRDVVGEFGISNFYGKIQRGYTDSILKNKNELSLNRIMKKRVALKQGNGKRGNATIKVSDNDNELWGLMYLVKPTGIDPNTGEEYLENININIPAFKPATQNFDTNNLNIKFYNNVDYNAGGAGAVYIYFCKKDAKYDFTIQEISENVDFIQSYAVYCSVNESDTSKIGNITVSYPSVHNVFTNNNLNETLFRDRVKNNLVFFVKEKEDIVNKNVSFQVDVANIINNIYTKGGFEVPKINGNNFPGNLIKYTENYNNIIYENNGKYYRVSSNSQTKTIYSSIPSNFNANNYVGELLISDDETVRVNRTGGVAQTTNNCTIPCAIRYDEISLSETELEKTETGTITIHINRNIIDEPYSMLLFPLCNCTIELDKTYTIKRANAFSIFNSCIQFLSGGSSPYLVDAQIFSYCPPISSVNTEIKGYPFFEISNNSSEVILEAQLEPYSDVKKEYLAREYSIVAPDQSNKTTFRFYDYCNEIIDENGKNKAKMQFYLKFAFKPFSIITSCMPATVSSELADIYYTSKLSGCQPASGGFEASLASNAFETYRRENSNYQQIFNKQQEELQKQHYVEGVNESVSGVLNTLTATSFGAIAGAATADAGIAGLFGTKSVGAGIGGAAAAATVGTAMIVQSVENEKLRNYEEELQKTMFDLNIGTIKNLPNTINRISSFNEIIMREFFYFIETYECTNYELIFIDRFIESYGYDLGGIFDYVANYVKDGWFIKCKLLKSSLQVNLHQIAAKELSSGVYIYEQV